MDADICCDRHVHETLESLLQLDIQSGPLRSDNSPRSKESLHPKLAQILGCAIHQLSELFQAESRKNAKTRESIDELRFYLKSCLDERSSHLENSFQDQVCQLKQLMGTISKELRKEVDQRAASNDQVVRDIVSLQQAHAKTRDGIDEVRFYFKRCLDERSSHLENSFQDQVCQLQQELDQRTAATDQVVRDIVSMEQGHEQTRGSIDELRLYFKSCLDERSSDLENSFQDQVCQLQQEVDQRMAANDQVVRDIVSVQHGHEKTRDSIDELVHELIQNTISEKIAAERNSREEFARAHEKAIRDMDSDISSQMASLRVDISAVREDCAQCQSSLQANIVKHFGEQQECIQNMISESDMLRTAMTQIVSNGTAQEAYVKKELDSLKESLGSYSTDIKALENASAERLNFQLHLQDQLASERLQTPLNELKNQIARCCEYCASKAIEVKLETAARFDSLKDILTEERACRIDALRHLEEDLRNGKCKSIN